MFVGNGVQAGKLGEPAYLEEWITTNTPIAAGESKFKVTFDWDERIGVPGAFIIKNHHHSEFYLKTLTLEDVPGQGRVHFVCNSWVYPAKYYKTDRVFFVNKASNCMFKKMVSKNAKFLVDISFLFMISYYLYRHIFQVKHRSHYNIIENNLDGLTVDEACS